MAQSTTLIASWTVEVIIISYSLRQFKFRTLKHRVHLPCVCFWPEWWSSIASCIKQASRCVGWVCCWFSSLLRGFFPPSSKTNIFQIPIRSGIRGPQVGQSEDCLVSPSLNKVNLFICLFIYLQKKLRQNHACSAKADEAANASIPLKYKACKFCLCTLTFTCYKTHYDH